MQRQTLLTVLTAAMLVLAGCAGSTGGDGSPTTTPTPDEGTTTDTGGTATGTVEFYVSDDPGQIDDFRHLNVTITEIGFEKADSAGEDDEEDADDDSDDADDEETENETEDENETAESTDGSTVENETGGVAASGDQQQTDDQTTEADDGDEADETDEEDETESDEDDEQESDEDDSEGDDEEREGWVTHDVDSRTVDLTQLKGDNATLIDSPEIPAGNYSKVFVHVSGINATLTDGTSVNVKLPSEKLQLNKGFTLEPNGSVSFVYDISVFKAGNSGKYILKPVISESGPDQDIEAADEDDEREDDEMDDDADDEDEQADEETEATEQKVTEEETAEEDAGGPPEDRGGN